VEILLSMNMNTTKVNKHKADYYYQTLKPIILREFNNGIKPYNQTLYNLFIGKNNHFSVVKLNNSLVCLIDSTFQTTIRSPWHEDLRRGGLRDGTEVSPLQKRSNWCVESCWCLRESMRVQRKFFAAAEFRRAYCAFRIETLRQSRFQMAI